MTKANYEAKVAEWTKSLTELKDGKPHWRAENGVLVNDGVWFGFRRHLLRQGVRGIFTVNYGPPYADIERFALQLAAKIDARQRRPRHLREQDIVVNAKHRDLFGHGDPAFSAGVNGVPGISVVSRQQRCCQ